MSVSLIRFLSQSGAGAGVRLRWSQVSSAGPVRGWSSEFGEPQRTISLSKLVVANTQRLQRSKLEQPNKMLLKSVRRQVCKGEKPDNKKIFLRICFVLCSTPYISVM